MPLPEPGASTLVAGVTPGVQSLGQIAQILGSGC